MAVREVFLVRYTFQRTPFFYWHRYFRFFPSCFYTFFALPSRESLDMPRTELSSAISQGYLDFYSLFSAITFLGLGLGSQIKTGPGPTINRPHNSPWKYCSPTSWSERRVLIMPRPYCDLLQICPSLMRMSLYLPGKHTGLWDILWIHSGCVLVVSLSENAPLMISLYETIRIQRLLTAWGSGMDIFSFTDFPGDSGRLNASCFAFHIRRKAGGYLP